MNLMLVIPFSTANWHLADSLCDWHRHLHNQAPCGTALLVAAADSHAEIRTKLKIAAELAFERVLEMQANTSATPLLVQAAAHIGSSYRWPWLWLEPGSVPLCKDWIHSIAQAYDEQPSRYFGPHLKAADSLALAASSIYTPAAINDLAAKRDLFPLSSKCRLIQYGQFTSQSALNAIRPDAVLYVSSPDGSLIEALRKANPENGARLIGAESDFQQIRGRPFRKKVTTTS